MKNIKSVRNSRKNFDVGNFFLNLDVCQIFETVDFGQNFEKKNHFGKVFRKSQF